MLIYFDPSLEIRRYLTHFILLNSIYVVPLSWTRAIAYSIILQRVESPYIIWRERALFLSSNIRWGFCLSLSSRRGWLAHIFFRTNGNLQFFFQFPLFHWRLTDFMGRTVRTRGYSCQSTTCDQPSGSQMSVSRC